MRHACTSLSRAAFASAIAFPLLSSRQEYRSRGSLARGAAAVRPTEWSAAQLNDVLGHGRRIDETPNRFARVVDEHVGMVVQPGRDGGIKRDELAGARI